MGINMNHLGIALGAAADEHHRMQQYRLRDDENQRRAAQEQRNQENWGWMRDDRNVQEANRVKELKQAEDVQGIYRKYADLNSMLEVGNYDGFVNAAGQLAAQHGYTMQAGDDGFSFFDPGGGLARHVATKDLPGLARQMQDIEIARRKGTDPYAVYDEQQKRQEAAEDRQHLQAKQAAERGRWPVDQEAAELTVDEARGSLDRKNMELRLWKESSSAWDEMGKYEDLYTQAREMNSPDGMEYAKKQFEAANARYERAKAQLVQFQTTSSGRGRGSGTGGSGGNDKTFDPATLTPNQRLEIYKKAREDWEDNLTDENDKVFAATNRAALDNLFIQGAHYDDALALLKEQQAQALIDSTRGSPEAIKTARKDLDAALNAVVSRPSILGFGGNDPGPFRDTFHRMARDVNEGVRPDFDTVWDTVLRIADSEKVGSTSLTDFFGLTGQKKVSDADLEKIRDKLEAIESAYDRWEKEDALKQPDNRRRLNRSEENQRRQGRLGNSEGSPDSPMSLEDFKKAVNYTSRQRGVADGGPHWRNPPESDLRELHTAVETTLGLPRGTVTGIFAGESAKGTPTGDDGRIESYTGVHGPYQMTEKTATAALKKLGIDVQPGDFSGDPKTDIRYNHSVMAPAAGMYIKEKLNANGGDIRKALAAWNAGQGAVNTAVAKAKSAGRPDDWIRFLPGIQTSRGFKSAAKVQAEVRGLIERALPYIEDA
ncbi:MAG: hypothetical protein FWH15_08240 [Betaproteobacteria bacterium]|nr:hypothetical protein [Betaproteobacteria bacterium]